MIPGNYIALIVEAQEAGMVPAGEFTEVTVEHDDDCGVYDLDPCDCKPNIRKGDSYIALNGKLCLPEGKAS